MRTQVRATATDYADATALRSTVTYGPSNRNLPAPGPFSAERTKNGESIGGALMTGLLVMYPVVAIIAVILMGFALPAVAG